MKNVGWLIVLTVCLGLPALAWAGGDSVDLLFQFPSPLVDHTEDGAQFTMPGAALLVRTGEPVLPMRTARIVIPPDAWPGDIEIEPGERVDLPGTYRLRVASPAFPLSQPGQAGNHPTQPTVGLFPGRLFAFHSVQHLRGARVVVVNLFPLQAEPQTGHVFYYKQLRVRISLRPDDSERGQLPFRGLAEDWRLLARTVENPPALADYSPPDEVYDYVIITNEELLPTFATYGDWLAANFGLAVVTETVENIYATMPGLDEQAQIRNFIIFAYTNWNAQYVLLGGDADPEGEVVIPHRGVYGQSEGHVDFDIPCDHYYAALDGVWDYNGNGVFGEPDDGAGGGEVDLLADVHLGRVAANTAEEASFQLEKIKTHLQSLPTGRALYVGELLLFNPLLWGGDYKDWVYQAMTGYPRDTLYERDGTFNAAAVTSHLATDDYDLVNHLGHANLYTVMGLFVSDILAINNAVHYLVYSQGCYAASYDNRHIVPGLYGADAIGEYFVNKTESAAWAFIGNSRYGWADYVPETSAGNLYDREFMYLVFNQDVNQVGPAFTMAKNAMVGYVNDIGPFRWTHFQLTLLGCPFAMVLMPASCDADTDGYNSPLCGGDDCDDGNAAINPGADEVCNGLDDNCNDETDEGGDALCDNGLFCDGAETCDGVNECQIGDEPCGNNGLFCDGDESCDEDLDQCESSGDPCGDNGLFCDGDESCDEDLDQCESSGDPCDDNGLFCDGDESCDEDLDQCESSGDPCEENEECNEELDECIAIIDDDTGDDDTADDDTLDDDTLDDDTSDDDTWDDDTVDDDTTDDDSADDDAADDDQADDDVTDDDQADDDQTAGDDDNDDDNGCGC